MIRLLLIIFFLEVGLVLAVAPWSAYWERNYFAGLIPVLHGVITNSFTSSPKAKCFALRAS